jgi:hypothetical protein
MEWCHKESPPSKNLKTQVTAGKIMTSMFWDIERVVHIDYLQHDVTVNAQYYSMTAYKVG